MSSTPACFRCSSNRVLTKHTARKVGAGLGAASGFGAAFSGALTGASGGAVLALHHVSDNHLSAQTLLSAIVGGLMGGIAGCAAGAAFGDALDQVIFDHYECVDCGYSFSISADSLSSNPLSTASSQH